MIGEEGLTGCLGLIVFAAKMLGVAVVLGVAVEGSIGFSAVTALESLVLAEEGFAVDEGL